MTARERRCPECGTPLVQRAKEKDANWTVRRYCSNTCASRGVAKREKAHTGSMGGERPTFTYTPTAHCQNTDCRKPILYTGQCYSCSTGRPRVLTPETLASYVAADRAGAHTREAAA